MKFSKEQRLLIGREICTHTITISQAAEKYGINRYTARDVNGLEPMSNGSKALLKLNI